MIRVAEHPYEDYGDVDLAALETMKCPLCQGTGKLNVGVEPMKGTPEYARALASTRGTDIKGVPLVYHEYDCWRCLGAGRVTRKEP